MTLLDVVVVLAVWSTASLVVGLVLCKTIYWMGKPEAGSAPQPDARTPRPTLPAPRDTDEQVAQDDTRRRAPALSSTAPAATGTSTRRPAL